MVIHPETRKPRQRRDLTKERILSAASDLIESKGAEALTMRNLASYLGVEAMSLYNHVANKSELLDAVAERMVAGIELPPSVGDWREDIRAFMKTSRAVALKHPEVTAMLLSRQVFTSSILRLSEEILRALQSGGFTIQDSVYAARVLLIYLAGALLREVRADVIARPEQNDSAERRLALLLASGYPTIVASATYLANPSGEAEFTFGLDLIIQALDI